MVLTRKEQGSSEKEKKGGGTRERKRNRTTREGFGEINATERRKLAICLAAGLVSTELFCATEITMYAYVLTMYRVLRTYE